MYKALIIDDEKPVRQIIKVFGMWQEFKIEHVFEAFEGESALEILRLNKPEIVFLDMNMPNMNGVEFLKVAVKEFPACKYIVISGYDDFEYTKQAINSKVLDYLLKPVNEDELNNVLKRAVTELNRDSERKYENIRKGIEKNVSIPLARERILTMILDSDQYFSLNDEQRRILGIADPIQGYSVVVFNILNFDQVQIGKFKGDKQLAFFALTNIINEMAASWCNGFSFKSSSANNEIILVIMESAAKDKETETEIVSYIAAIVDKLEELFGTYCIASVGKKASEFEALQMSYQSALEILHNVNILNNDNKVFYRWINDNKTKRISIMDKKDILIYAFEGGSLEHVRNVIVQYFDDIRVQGHVSRDDLYKIAMEFVLILEEVTAQLGISDSNISTRILSNTRTIKTFSSLDQLREHIFSVIEQLFTCIKSNLKASEKTNLFEIKDYIEKNFDSEIKLSYFSGKYFVSKEYLSKQFKAEFGYGIYEYVLKIRMERAAQLLENTDTKISQIADYVGYRDNNYFSKAFKNYYGIYPSEFRNKEEK